YGPFFSIIIAPFAILPTYIGCFLWGLANAALLFYAVRKLPLTYHQQNIILLVGAVELMTSLHNMQTNPMITAWILLGYIMVIKEKDLWGAMFIMAAIFTK